MNGAPRVLLIGRHFWPHGSIDSAGYLIQLATGLRRRGFHVEVLTPRYASSWAHQFNYRDIRVHRPAAAPRGDWSMSRYVRHLAHWLREHAAGFDVLLADTGREEAIAAVEAARTLACRSIVRVSGWGHVCDNRWWKTSRSAKRCAGFAKTADRIVTSNADVHRELIRDGFDAARITRIELGIRGGVSRSDFSRSSARRALGAINADLGIPDDVNVVVCIGGMMRTDGMQLLTKSVRPLVEKFNDLQFWFIGDGPQRESIYEYLRADGVRTSIAMPGSFSDIGDVLAAADLFVQSDDRGLDYLLPAAISAELPLAVVDTESTRQVINGPAVREQTEVDSPSAGELLRWFSDSKAHSMRMAIDATLSDLERSRQNAAELRRLLLRRQPLDRSIDQYARLIEDTMVRGVSARGASMGAVS